MVKLQLELTEKANKNLAGYTLYNGHASKAESINFILEHINIKNEFKEWLEND